MILQPLAAEIGLRQLVALDHRAHRAVENEDAFGQRAIERADRRGARCGVRGGLVLVRHIQWLVVAFLVALLTFPVALLTSLVTFVSPPWPVSLLIRGLTPEARAP